MRALWQKAGFLSFGNLVRESLHKDSSFVKSGTLFLSMIVSMGLTFLSSIVTARALGPAHYGDMKFILTVWSLFALVMTLGHFHSGGRILALEKDYQRSCEVTGLLLLMAFLTGVAITVVTILIAFPLNNLLQQNLAMKMIWLAPLVLVAPLTSAITLILQGTNRIYLLSLFQVIPSALYLVAIFLLNLIQRIDVISVIVAQQLTAFVVIVYVMVQLKPTLRSLRFWWKEIVKQNKTYGSQVYYGSLAAVASGQINRLSISYWVDNTAIGFYSLASSLVEPLKLIPNAVATTSFRKFAHQEKITRKVIIATVAASLLTLVGALIFFGKPLAWLYSKDFGPAGSMACFASFGAVLHGFGDLFNRFLGAHGKGKVLRNTAYLIGVVNIIGFLFLVPRFGAWGAILTTYIATGAAYFFYMLINYLRFLNSKTGKIGGEVNLVSIENDRLPL